MHEPLTNLRPVIFLQFARRAPRSEVWRGFRRLKPEADFGKIVIAVSEDIDPNNTDAVLWSLAYRSQSDRGRACVASTGRGVQGAQYGPPQRRLDAPDRRHPQTADAAARPAGAAFMERARTIWEELGLPPLSVAAPWHGYTLGDWTDAWETYARRAAAGNWEKSGRETLARQATGLAPEAPVRAGSATMAE